MKYKILSHIIDENTPSYGNSGTVKITADKQILKGDSCNTYRISLNNHIGTHMDCPNHFDKDGCKNSDYSIDKFIFTKPCLLEIIKKKRWIEKIDIKKHRCEINGKDIILIKTGFEKYRNLKKFMFENPGIDAEVFEYLRNEFPTVRAVGIDVISISSHSDRQRGRLSHNSALCIKPEILIIEDMKLSELFLNDRIKKILIAPLFIDKIDSAPVTVIAEID